MKAITFEEFGTADVMDLAEVAITKVSPGDLLVRVGAAGVNPADPLQRAGFYGRENFGDGALLRRNQDRVCERADGARARRACLRYP
jgi:NADPH:quinone reductase